MRVEGTPTGEDDDRLSTARNVRVGHDESGGTPDHARPGCEPVSARDLDRHRPHAFRECAERVIDLHVTRDGIECRSHFIVLLARPP